jgi:hypothetical protein
MRHVAGMERLKVHTEFLSKKINEINHVGVVGVDAREIEMDVKIME